MECKLLGGGTKQREAVCSSNKKNEKKKEYDTVPASSNFFLLVVQLLKVKSLEPRTLVRYKISRGNIWIDWRIFQEFCSLPFLQKEIAFACLEGIDACAFHVKKKYIRSELMEILLPRYSLTTATSQLKMEKKPAQKDWAAKERSILTSAPEQRNCIHP